LREVPSSDAGHEAFQTLLKTGHRQSSEVLKRGLLAMAEHKFKIRQVVYFRPKKSSAPLSASSGPYQIVRLLPATEGEYQYVIRSVAY
jgi:hypothetical protein